MNTWKPSEGLRRAEPLVAEIHCAIIATDGVIPPLGRHRAVELIAKAIDQALRDGSEMDAINSLTGGNGADLEKGPYDLSDYQRPHDAAVVVSQPATAATWGNIDGSPNIRPAKKRGRPKGSKRKAKEAKQAEAAFE